MLKSKDMESGKGDVVLGSNLPKSLIELGHESLSKLGGLDKIDWNSVKVIPKIKEAK